MTRSHYVRGKFSRLKRVLDRKREEQKITPAHHDAGVRACLGQDLLFRNRNDLNVLARIFPKAREDLKTFEESDRDQQTTAGSR